MTIRTDFPNANVSYNGYVFSARRLLLASRHRPQLDDAKRTVIATQHSFTFQDIIQATDQQDGTKVDTTSIRRQLLVPVVNSPWRASVLAVSRSTLARGCPTMPCGGRFRWSLGGRTTAMARRAS